MNLEPFERAIRKVKLNSCLIIRDNELLFEYYRNNKIRHNAQKINSCTKSVLSALIGIAIDQGAIRSISEPISRYFPEWINAQPDSRKQSITIEHLLAMSAGFDWPEFGEWNYFAPMVFSPNIVKYVLDRELLDDPGDKMNYNSGCSHVLTAILQQATGRSAIAFAEAYLFKPLGITNFDWVEDNRGINRGADGLRLTTEDMAKIGLLFLNKGMYGNKRVISSEWVEKSTAPYYSTYEHIGKYGYHWWIKALDNEEILTSDNKMIFALGYGGQYICMIPHDKIVIAITSEIYEDTMKPLSLLEEHVLSSLAR
ncbi:serine hydrolase domain-containing protein [Paenibacillus sp. NPDC058071]|uniref:serine hydrolase domain-containing protein n=1 Tax=Paenibacillus sp. NPDC058071 TaxID=3346326 RepID=UPI0036D7D987